VGFFYFYRNIYNKKDMPKNKIIITESQLKLITNLIKEDSNITKTLVKDVVNYLKKYYEPSFGTYEKGGEYHNEITIVNKIDNQHISPKNLLRHLISKFKLGPDFLGQVIRDWYDGKLDTEFLLSQNISPNN